MHAARALGLDLAWTDTNPTGACALDRAGRLVDEQHLYSDDEVVAWIRDVAADEAVVAVDAPLQVPNETGRRAGEPELAHEYNSRKAGPHSSNRSRLIEVHGRVRGEDLRHRLANEGFQGPWSGSRRTLIEVYPHPALVESFGLEARLVYKAKRGVSVDQRREGLRTLDRLLGLLKEADPPMDAPRLPISSDVRGRSLKEIEDRLDARICAWIAAAWHRHGTERVRLFGSEEAGHIAVPVGEFVSPEAVDEALRPLRGSVGK